MMLCTVAEFSDKEIFVSKKKSHKPFSRKGLWHYRVRLHFHDDGQNHRTAARFFVQIPS